MQDSRSVLVALGAATALLWAAKVLRQVAFWATLRLGPARTSSFKGETALVTGASYGIGKSLATALAQAGLNLVVVARGEDRLQALAQELRAAHGVQVHVIAADLALPDGGERVADEVEAAGLQVSVLIANAGGVPPKCPMRPVWLHSREQLDYIAHLNGHVYPLARRLVPGMVARGRGMVLAVSSVMSAFPRFAIPYASEKAKLECFMAGLASELEGTGVAAQAIVVGPTVTPGSLSNMGRRAEDTPATWASPSCDTVAASVLRVAGRGGPVEFAYWPHVVLAAVVKSVPGLYKLISDDLSKQSTAAQLG